MEAFLFCINIVISAAQLIFELYFLSCFTKKKVKVLHGILFIIIALFVMLIIQTRPSLFTNVATNILLMILMSKFILRNDWIVSLVSAIIASEIMLLSFGTCNSFLSLLSPVIYNNGSIGAVMMKYLSIFSMWVSLVFANIFYYLIQKYFSIDENQINQYMLFMLLPLLLIFFSGEYISGSVYGNVVEINSKGVIVGINHFQMLFIQILAICSIFSVLFAFKKLHNNFKDKTKLAVLEQESRMQREYIEEAKSRYKETQSFRHDIKNHMMILNGIMESGNTTAAVNYLNKLDNVTAELSFPCQTNNAVLDILLNSKLSLAKQVGIKAKCTFEVPENCEIDDLDFCIVFSNALDNAINACKLVKEEDRYLDILGSKQGDFLMLQIENSCIGYETAEVEYGIGLSNITGVAEKYNGATNIEIKDNKFILNVLFVISQQL